MNIVLIGMRGSGKTTVGELLAKKLNRDLIETDALIVAKAGMSIAEIVEKHGWEHFRDLESEIAKEMAIVDNALIATGGGVVVRWKNIERLKKNGMLIYLKTDVDTLVSRIGNDPNRPALTKKKSLRDELTQVLQVRRSLYERAADKIIETNSMSPEETANAIIPEVTNLLHLGGDLYLTPREKQYD